MVSVSGLEFYVCSAELGQLLVLVQALQEEVEDGAGPHLRVGYGRNFVSVFRCKSCFAALFITKSKGVAINLGSLTSSGSVDT